MRASSPAFALVPRSLSIPRPGPRPVPKADEITSEYSLPTKTTAAPASTLDAPDAPRPTLLSADLEVLAHVEAHVARSTVPPPLPARARDQHRVAASPRTPAWSHPEIADSAFAALRDLGFFETPVEAASFGVVTAMRVLPSLAALGLLRDEQRGGYVVVYARGPRSHTVVRTRVADDDPIVGLSLVRGGPVVVEYGSDTPPPARHASFGEPWTALVAPIELEGRCVGVLELVDPLDGRTLGDSARQALSTITQHLAVFLRGRDLVVADAFAPEQVGLEDAP
jgi:GAF domain-containing protein